MNAPIALFVYNRPVHTRRTVEALLKNEPAAESDLFIFSDAPKKPEAAGSVREVREYIRTIKGFQSIKIVERNQNWGLANSIIDGVTTIVNQYGRVIVLEDDLVVSPHFLTYMNTALERYRDNDQVMQVSGHVFPAEFEVKTDAMFLPMTTSWGWATWARSWEHFDPTSRGFVRVKEDAVLRKRFNLGGAYDYFTMLEDQLAGRVDSWAVRWYLSVFLRGGLTLFPAKSLVENFGFDGSGTHCGAGQAAGVLAQDFIVHAFPPVIADEMAQEAVNCYLAGQGRAGNGMWRRLSEWLGARNPVTARFHN